MVRRIRAAATAALRLLLVAGLAMAGQAALADGDQPASQQDPGQAAWAAAEAAMVRGPAKVPLRDQAVLDLPGGFGYVPTKEATAVMGVMGNRVDSRFIGLVFPLGEQDMRYFITLDYEDAGYIKDDEAREWDADELLQSLKDGTEASNADREKAGVAAIKVTRWIEPPAYDPTAHRLKWSAEATLKQGRDDDPTINYNTYLLGREGYITADLITSTAHVAADKSHSRPVVEALSFNDGKRYADFKPSTDKVAAYGLTALVAGVAAKKIGLFAVAAAFAAKFIKVIIAAAVGLGAVISRLLKGRSGGSPGAGA